MVHQSLEKENKKQLVIGVIVAAKAEFFELHQFHLTNYLFWMNITDWS